MHQIMHPTDVPAALRQRFDQEFRRSLQNRESRPNRAADDRNAAADAGRQGLVAQRSLRTQPCDSLGCVLGHLGEVTLGVLCLLIGTALVFTLWLMPVGLPLALFGAALVGAGSQH